MRHCPGHAGHGGPRPVRDSRRAVKPSSHRAIEPSRIPESIRTSSLCRSTRSRGILATLLQSGPCLPAPIQGSTVFREPLRLPFSLSRPVGAAFFRSGRIFPFPHGEGPGLRHSGFPDRGNGACAGQLVLIHFCVPCWCHRPTGRTGRTSCPKHCWEFTAHGI